MTTQLIDHTEIAAYESAITARDEKIADLTREVTAYATTVENMQREIDALKIRAQSSELMAECTSLLRSDLIEAGIIDKSVPPMMLIEAIMARVKHLKAENESAVEAGHVAVEMCSKLISERDALKADAERFLHLATALSDIDALEKFEGSFHGADLPNCTTIDEVRDRIDAAMKAEP